jgi:Xaa-Pro aminopeptidase
VQRHCFVYAKQRNEIEAQWQATRDADAAGLRSFVPSLRFGAELRDELCATARGFEVLDRLCAEKGLGAVLVSSPFNVEMFSGLPENFIGQWGIQALFVPGYPHITLLSERELIRSDFAPKPKVQSVLEFASSVGVGCLGVEEQYLGIGDYNVLEARGVNLVGVSELVRQWQELRASSDLGYYIAAANAAIAGISHSMEYMHREFDAGFTENTLAAIYRQGVDRFVQQVSLDGRIRGYFDIIHAGERTVLPAIASGYRVDRSNKTIKFDMGLFVLDSAGCVRGCSDIARSISPNPDLQEMHDLLRRLLVDKLIPAIQPGMSGGDVHQLGIDVLRPHTHAFCAAGMLPESMAITGYTRDCGHTLERQTITTLHFLPGEKRALATGMLGCTEYVWPFEDKILAVEDGYFVTARGSIPFTA